MRMKKISLMGHTKIVWMMKLISSMMRLYLMGRKRSMRVVTPGLNVRDVLQP
jgi:hypothetical protein